MKIHNALVSNILDRSRYFAHVTTVTLSWRVQNIVVIGRVYFTLECFEFSSNFELDRNMLSGTGAMTNVPAKEPIMGQCSGSMWLDLPVRTPVRARYEVWSLALQNYIIFIYYSLNEKSWCTLHSGITSDTRYTVGWFIINMPSYYDDRGIPSIQMTLSHDHLIFMCKVRLG